MRGPVASSASCVTFSTSVSPWQSSQAFASSFSQATRKRHPYGASQRLRKADGLWSRKFRMPKTVRDFIFPTGLSTDTSTRGLFDVFALCTISSTRNNRPSRVRQVEPVFGNGLASILGNPTLAPSVVSPYDTSCLGGGGVGILKSDGAAAASASDE